MTLPQIDPVTAAVLQLAGRLRLVGTEVLPIGELAGRELAGRVLAEPLLADRDNPPLDVSAMDGYALRLADIVADAAAGWLPVSGVAVAGSPAPVLERGKAVQIFTGAPVPAGADCVVPREQTRESPERMELTVPILQLKAGQNIRRRGENAYAGSEVLPHGTCLTSAAIAAIASVAAAEIVVHRKVRVAVVNTGDELIAPGQPAEDWQIRDSNGPTLEAALARYPWLEVVARRRVADHLASIADNLGELLPSVDAVILTGGVSMGDTDHVPGAVRESGGEIVFHRLPIRPGKPVLGAVAPEGKLIVGLPGNPVSVAVTAAVIALPLLRQLGGLAEILPGQQQVLVSNSDDKKLNLHWYRLVELGSDGQLRYVDSRGSGDLIALGRSAGFVTVPAGMSGPGPWPLQLWS